MSNRKSRLDKLESFVDHTSSAAVIKYTGLGQSQDYTSPDARFKIGNEDDITYDEIQARGYAFITYMPVKAKNKWKMGDNGYCEKDPAVMAVIITAQVNGDESNKIATALAIMATAMDKAIQ